MDIRGVPQLLQSKNHDSDKSNYELFAENIKRGSA